MICGAMGFTFWPCLAFLLLMGDMMQIVGAGDAPRIDEVKCFRCDEFSPCLEQRYVCDLVPDCLNGRDELTMEGGGCYQIDAVDDGEDEEEKRLGPVIYAIAGFIGLEIIAILGTVMYLLNIRCCQCARDPKTRVKRKRSVRQSPPRPLQRRMHGLDRLFYTNPRKAVAAPIIPRPQPWPALMSAISIDNRPEPIFSPIVPHTAEAGRSRGRFYNRSRLWPGSSNPMMDKPRRRPFQIIEPGSFSSTTKPQAAGRFTDASHRHREIVRRSRPGPQTIPSLPNEDQNLVKRCEPRPIIHHQHTTVNNFTLILPARAEKAGSIEAPCATLAEIIDENKPGTSGGRTASSSCRKIVPLHRPHKGTNVYDIGNLC